MLEKVRTITKRKGQGIVEYALLLAFVVGIAMMLNGANLGGAVKGVFDDVANLLGGETVALTPEEADKQKMLKIGEVLKKNFKFGNYFGFDAEDGKIVLKGNYICVYVTGDGTADIHVQDKASNRQGWFYLNNSQYFTAEETAYYNNALAELNLLDQSKWAVQYTDADSQWKNGYAVMYDKTTGNVSYWNMSDSINKDNFNQPNGGVDKHDLYTAAINPNTNTTSSNKHTRITGITD